MKTKMAGLMALTIIVSASLFAGASGEKTATWKVTCPWAPSGVAAMVNQKAAALSTTYSKNIVLVAEAVRGDAATLNTWVASTKANDTEMVFASESLLAITQILDPAKILFKNSDFIFVDNLYSAIMVMSADSKLGVKSVPELEAYLAKGSEVSVAVNGAMGSEAFLAAALFGAMGRGSQLKLVAYSSAAEAAQAVSKGETDLAISHQSQILETYQQGGVSIVCAFDGDDIKTGPFAGVEGIGKYKYPYYSNHCFIMARAGTDPAKIADVKKLFRDILSDKEVVQWMTETMMIKIELMDEADLNAFLGNVRNIVDQYKDLILN
jgi:tripartite-type tricarboxylate transporter receptor subunit TctC